MRPITAPDYYKYYIALNPGEDIVKIFEEQLPEMEKVFAGISEEKAEYAYQPGKWTIKELLGHITDTERVMAYRAMCIARRDTTSFPGFEEDDYVRNAHFARRSLSNILAEFSTLRKANIIMAQSFTDEDLLHIGTANKYSVDVAGLLFMIAGHATHHLKVLHERYLTNN